MSIDSNLAGYDIKSRVSEDSSDILLIEVKASTYALGQAVFHVTSHEWNVALTSRAYVFHLWCLSNSKKMLAVISPTSYCLTSPLTIWKDNGKAPKFRFHVLKDNL